MPFAWVYAFYQNFTALAGGEAIGLRELIKKTGRQTALRPRQNFVLLLILACFTVFNFTVLDRRAYYES